MNDAELADALEAGYYLPNAEVWTDTLVKEAVRRLRAAVAGLPPTDTPPEPPANAPEIGSQWRCKLPYTNEVRTVAAVVDLGGDRGWAVEWVGMTARASLSDGYFEDVYEPVPAPPTDPEPPDDGYTYWSVSPKAILMECSRCRCVVTAGGVPSHNEAHAGGAVL